MKALTILLSLTLTIVSYSQTQNKTFNQELFEKALMSEMESQFPMLKMDTSLVRYVKARSQEEAGYPECYFSKMGGMVNLEEDELKQAKRLVTMYKKHLSEDFSFDKEELIRCSFTDYCVATVLQYGGLIRYGIIVDNNFRREDLIFEGVKMEEALEELKNSLNEKD